MSGIVSAYMASPKSSVIVVLTCGDLESLIIKKDYETLDMYIYYNCLIYQNVIVHLFQYYMSVAHWVLFSLC